MARRRDIDRLQGEIQELFADLWQVPRFSGLRPGFRPLVDCYRTDDPSELTNVVELPGVDPDSLGLDVSERELVVSGERPRPDGAGRVYQQLEIEYGAFERRVPLGTTVDADGASASYQAGMLTVTLPLASPRQTGGYVAIVVRRQA